MKSIFGNIKKNYIYTFLSTASFQEAVWMLYLANRGMSLIQIGLLESIFHITSMFCEVPTHLSNFIFAFSFKEPTINRAEGNTGFRHHISDSIKAIRANKGVLRYIFYFEGFSLLYTTLYFYFQNFLKSRGYVEYQIGLVLAVSAGMGVLSAVLAYRIEKRLGEKKLIVIVSPISVLLFGLVALTRLEPLVMILISGVEGILFVVFSDYINKRIPSKQRATILSFEAMVFSVMMIVFFPVVGAVSENFGFKTAFALIAVIALVITTLSTLIMLLKDDFAEKQDKMLEKTIE